MMMQRRRRGDSQRSNERVDELFDEEVVTAPPAAARTSAPVPVSTRVDTSPAAVATPTQTTPTREADGGWGTIIDSVLSVEPERLFAKLTSELTLEHDHTSYAAVAQALDLADRRYFECSLLVRAAKLEEQRIDRAVNMRLEVLRTTAREEIETEKRTAAAAVGSKASGKATLEEVRDRCFASWPDEVSALERRSQEYHAARAVAEELAVSWRSRATSLRELVAGLRTRSA
jgi:hypothetical protein